MAHGQKGWVQRISKLVYVLVPDTTHEKHVVGRARAACRLAYTQGLHPIYPPLIYYPFLTQDEVSRELERNSQWWLRRVSKIWLAFPIDEEDTWRLDNFSHDVLTKNQGPYCKNRLPVHLLHPVGDSYLPVAMSRDDVDNLLMENATAGMSGMGLAV